MPSAGRPSPAARGQSEAVVNQVGDGLRLGHGDQARTASFFRSISAKSMAAPSPGAAHRVDEAVGIHLDVLGQAVLLRLRRQQHLEELAVLDGHDHVEVRDVVQRVAAVVDLEVHVEALGEMRGLDQRRDPALDRDVPAQIVGGAGHEPGRIGGEAARRVLGGEDRDVELLLELDVVVEVVVGQGVLVPVEAQLLDGPSRRGSPRDSHTPTSNRA